MFITKCYLRRNVHLNYSYQNLHHLKASKMCFNFTFVILVKKLYKIMIILTLVLFMSFN